MSSLKNTKPILIALFILLIANSCKTEFKESKTNYPLPILDSIIKNSVQTQVDMGFALNNKGMLALSVYLMDDTNVLVDKTYYLSNNQNDLPNENTLFQLGSVTKVFTAAMIAQQVNNGKLDLNTPVADYLPKGRPFIPNSFDGKLVSINLKGLTTMSSGLPRNAPVNRKTDSTSYLFAFSKLKSTNLLFAPQSDCYLYSNLGFGIAGLVLSNQAYPNGEYYYDQYETVLIDSLLNPMKMNNTRITLDSIQKTHRALPYNKNKKENRNYWNPNWPMNYAAGGLYSTAPDMNVFAKNMIGEGTVLTNSVIDTILKSRSKVRKGLCGIPTNDQAMGWILQPDFRIKGNKQKRFYKDGGLSGTSTLVTFSNPKINGKKYKGYVVMLVNKEGFPVKFLSEYTLQKLFNLIPGE